MNLTVAENFFKKAWSLLQPLCIFAWVCTLPAERAPDGAYGSINYILAAAAFLTWFQNFRNPVPSTCRERLVLGAASCLFCGGAALVNYDYWLTGWEAYRAIPAVLIFPAIGGVCAAYSILKWAMNVRFDRWSDMPASLRPRSVFLICFGIIAVIYLAFFFLMYYPGCLTPDSIWQIQQIATGEYSNHHPFYHTMLIRAMMWPGMTLSGSSNAAVATYSVFQILCMSAIFAYTLMTMFQKGAPMVILLTGFVWFALHPVHIMYSFTVWKDVLFGGMALLFTAACFRLLYMESGRRLLDYTLFALGGFGICLLRSNGLFAFAVALIVFAVLFRKQYKLMLGIMIAVTLCSVILRGPVLRYLRVTPVDPVESYSIPVQQIACVIREGRELKPDERAFLAEVADLEKLDDVYHEHISDPVKNLIRKKNNQAYIQEHLRDLVKVWYSLGTRNPWLYTRAWVDQTKGFWYGGYRYWVFAPYISENDLAIYHLPVCGPLRGKWEQILYNIKSSAIESALAPLFSIGLAVWLVFAVIVIALARKMKKLFFLPVPFAAVIISLMIATPVYCEFRYAYAVFTGLPLLIFAFLAEKKTITDTKHNEYGE